MTSCVHNIIRNATKSFQPLNILVASYDGIFEWSLCECTQNNYYILKDTQKLQSIPIIHNNLYTLDVNNIPLSLDIDLIICNDVINQINICDNISKKLHIPLVIIHHGIAPQFVKKEDMSIVLRNYRHAHRIVTHPYINKSWYAKFNFMPYCITLDTPINKTQDKILIIGNFDDNTKNIIQIIKQKSKKEVIVISPDTPLYQCLEYLKSHTTFINLFNDLDINLLMLYAMAAGCTVITHPSLIIQQFISHEENGYIGKSLDEIITLANIQHLPFIGKNAKNTIKNYTNNATLKWKEFFNIVSHTAFKV